MRLGFSGLGTVQTFKFGAKEAARGVAKPTVRPPTHAEEMCKWYCSSTTQVPVSLSSGEAETYGVTKAFSRAIGMRNLANDLGFERYG